MGTVHCLVYFNLFHCDGLIVLICSPYFSVSECDKVLRMVDVLKSEWTAFMSSRGLTGLARFSRGCEYEYQPGIWRVGCLISVCVGSQLSRMLYSPNAICLCMRVCVRSGVYPNLAAETGLRTNWIALLRNLGTGLWNRLLGFMWCVSRCGLVRGNLLSWCLSNNLPLQEFTIICTKILLFLLQ